MTLRTSRSDSSVRSRDLVDGLVGQRADFVLDVEQHRDKDRALGRIVRDHGGEALFELVGEFHVLAISSQPSVSNLCHPERSIRVLRECGVEGPLSHLNRPYGTRIHFPPYPALRLRLRAGLSCFAPTALVFRYANFTTNKL